MKIYNIPNKQRNKKQIYESIMREASRQIRRKLNEAEETDELDNKDEDEDIDEDVLNEFFGFGKSDVKKPEKSLSLENSDDENAELAMKWIGYYISNASNNVQKGLSNFMDKFGSIIVQSPKMLVKGVLMLMSGSIRGLVLGATTVAGIVVGSVLALVKLGDKAKNALQAMLKNLQNGVATFYKNMKAKTEEFVNSSEKTLERWMGVATGALTIATMKVEGAVDTVGGVVSTILNDAKKGVQAAVLISKTWLSTKAEEIKNWIVDTVGDIKSAVAKAWNALDKKVRNTYNNAVSKLEDWMNNLKELFTKSVENAKNFIVDKKDKALIYGIQKAVKGLSNNYTEDQVVAIVRKCYELEEGLKPMYNGNYLINEKYFYNKNNRRYRLV